VLRRTKDQVLSELPPKMFRDAEVELTAEQRHSYQLAEDEGVLRLSELGDGATIQHVFELSSCGLSKSATSIPQPATARSSSA